MSILEELGKQIRTFREARHLSREGLAKKARLSPRFLAEVEAGRGNIAFSRLQDLCLALELPMITLLASVPLANQKQLKSTPNLYFSIFDLLSHCSTEQLQEAQLLLSQRFDVRQKRIALIGLRGAGKTTIGKKVARRLKWNFIELDERIEKAAGLTLQNIFEVQGEDYYRSLEKQTLLDFLMDVKPSVIAAAGGIVAREDTYDLLRRNCITFWLKANPADHWSRVLKQDPRPITNYPNAFTQLQNLLRQREPLYAQADFQVDTSQLKISESVARIQELAKEHLHTKIRNSHRERSRSIQ
jgi:XRE family transcriptional regulator, aerobic/anaerobic benzoate catabolism transcriptional regulator